MTELLDNLRSPILLAAAVAVGLQAGTYYTWASGVMPGLARVDDRTFVHAMQQMNVAIVNPVFLATFLGAPALAVVAIASADGPARAWVVAGAGLAVATVAITAAGNIPLNNALDAAGPIDRITDLAGVREAFESGWVRLNIARAVTSTASLGCLVWAALRG
jgi:uncharacterized membrane protein